MKRFVSGLSLFLLLTGCVTTHGGPEVESSSQSYSMSCDPRSDIRTDHFTTLNCTVENKGTDWMDVRVKSIDFSPQDATIKVSSPQDIDDFLAAYKYKAEKEDYNTKMLLASMIVVGTAAGLAGGKSESSIGAGLTLSALGAMAATDISQEHEKVQNSGLSYSKDHLLGPGFRIPAGLFVRKFVLIETKPNAPFPNTARVCLTSPKEECLDLPLLRYQSRNASY